MGKNKTLRDRASDLVDTLAPHVETARDVAGPALADARDRAVPLLVDARDRAVPLLVDARDRAVPLLVDARDRATPLLSDARDRATPLLSDARDRATPYLDKAAPYLSDAREKAAPLVAEARDRITHDVLPALNAAVAAVDDATEDVRTETLKRGKAVAAALRGEAAAALAPEPTSHKLRNVLLALGLGGAGFAAYKKFGPQQSTSSWQSSYTPPPVGVPTTNDTAASDPAEAAADATDVPHTATTPDNPVIVVDVDKP
jgi:vacuolar-type H+-ATPase subunit H